jgi:hypothetical protein
MIKEPETQIFTNPHFILFEKNYDYIETLRSQNNFSWEALNKEFGNLCKNGEVLRSSYSRFRRKKATILYEKITPTILTSETTKEISQEEKFSFQSGIEDKVRDTKEFTFTADKIPTEEEIIFHFNLDTNKYKIDRIYHKTSFGGKYAITISISPKVFTELIQLNEDFLEKISKIKPLEITESTKKDNNNNLLEKEKACLLIPKQDAHFNKFDIGGENDIEVRFQEFKDTLINQLNKIIRSHDLEKIVYIIGSDEFNSEWTSMTTKGTPQTNILTYNEAFEKICDFNIEIIRKLLWYGDEVEVVLLNGNHDHNVGWHLGHLLKKVFSITKTISVNTSIENTKLIPMFDTLCMLNHGDTNKPKDLANKFPIIAKDIWSDYSNHIVISGDKHHELAQDFNGIRTYQVPQLSKAKSEWDDKKIYLGSKPELISFLFEEDNLYSINRSYLKVNK